MLGNNRRLKFATERHKSTAIPPLAAVERHKSTAVAAVAAVAAVERTLHYESDAPRIGALMKLEAQSNASGCSDNGDDGHGSEKCSYAVANLGTKRVPALGGCSDVSTGVR
jgi:hypothetical protein